MPSEVEAALAINKSLADFAAQHGEDRIFIPRHHLQDCGYPVDEPTPGSTVHFSDYQNWSETLPDGTVRVLQHRGRNSILRERVVAEAERFAGEYVEMVKKLAERD
jgi:hypothetical protein